MIMTCEPNVTINVLLVDEDPSTASLLSTALIAAGFDVDVAGDLEDGVRNLGAHPPHIVVIDLRLPDIDGRKACRAIRLSSSVPIVALSALDKPAAVASILDAGADDCLVKPVPMAVLVAHLNKLARRTGALLPSRRSEPDVRPATFRRA